MVYDDLAGKCILITGASRGIGREMAREFHSLGSNVAINYNASRAEAEQLKKELGSRAEIYKADVSQKSEVSRMVKSVITKFGSVDCLINNAGIVDGMRFDQFDETKFNTLWGINFMGSLYPTLDVINYMKKERSGSIINLSSNLGIGGASSGATFYGMTKMAVISLTKRLAYELGGYGIRANAIAPGWIRTDMTTRGRTPAETRRSEKIIRSKNALRMIGEPKHIAKLALFLASEDSALITGQTIVADGGRFDYLSHAY